MALDIRRNRGRSKKNISGTLIIESKIAPRTNKTKANIRKYPFTLFSFVPSFIEERASNKPVIAITAKQKTT